jgi:hypothetical protein
LFVEPPLPPVSPDPILLPPIVNGDVEDAILEDDAVNVDILAVDFG